MTDRCLFVGIFNILPGSLVLCRAIAQIDVEIEARANVRSRKSPAILLEGELPSGLGGDGRSADAVGFLRLCVAAPDRTVCRLRVLVSRPKRNI